MYDWTLTLAARPSAPYAPGTVSLFGRAFFPAPPDTLEAPMALARPGRAWFHVIAFVGCFAAFRSLL